MGWFCVATQSLCHDSGAWTGATEESCHDKLHNVFCRDRLLKGSCRNRGFLVAIEPARSVSRQGWACYLVSRLGARDRAHSVHTTDPTTMHSVVHCLGHCS